MLRPVVRAGDRVRWPLYRLAAACLACAFTVPATLPAQEENPAPRAVSGPHGFLFRAPQVTLGVRGGFNLRRAGSEVFDFVTNQLTLNRSDFNAFSVAGDLAFEFGAPVDFVLSAGFSETSHRSEFRDYVDQNDRPITQRNILSTVPLTAAVRWYLVRQGRQIGRFAWIPARFTPYVGVGGGVVRYRFEQAGSFVDFADLSIFEDRLDSEGWAPLGMVMAGVDYSLGPRVVINSDVRYLRARGRLHGDFEMFRDGIDLSGVQLSAGLHVRI